MLPLREKKDTNMSHILLLGLLTSWSICGSTNSSFLRLQKLRPLAHTGVKEQNPESSGYLAVTDWCPGLFYTQMSFILLKH